MNGHGIGTTGGTSIMDSVSSLQRPSTAPVRASAPQADGELSPAGLGLLTASAGLSAGGMAGMAVAEQRQKRFLSGHGVPTGSNDPSFDRTSHVRLREQGTSWISEADRVLPRSAPTDLPTGPSEAWMQARYLDGRPLVEIGSDAFWPVSDGPSGYSQYATGTKVLAGEHEDRFTAASEAARQHPGERGVVVELPGGRFGAIAVPRDRTPDRGSIRNFVPVEEGVVGAFDNGNAIEQSDSWRAGRSNAAEWSTTLRGWGEQKLHVAGLHERVATDAELMAKLPSKWKGAAAGAALVAMVGGAYLGSVALRND